MTKYSLVIPVYDRPQEIEELLESITHQQSEDFEVIIVEDGSHDDCESSIKKYSNQLDLKYFKIPNTGPSGARNYGAAQANGEWLIFLDSDTLLPENYLIEVDSFLAKNETDAFGGADKDREDFLPIQKAISYSMTSFLTTGGIRGSRKSLEKFKPRSFNMGVKSIVFDHLNGFGKMRYGEDIDFSLRIEHAGFKSAYIPEAFVYHKRRTSFKSFFKQIRHSGQARILLSKIHRGSFKLVHLFPAAFSFGYLIAVMLLFLFPLLGLILLLVYLAYFSIILVHATMKSRKLKVGVLSTAASFVQLTAYGYGFAKAGILTLLKG